MANVLSIARSFGKLSSIGKELLKESNHRLFFPPEDYFPLDEKKISNLVEKLEIEAIVVGADKIKHKVLDSGNLIKIIAKHGAGLDNIDVDYATSKNIAVTYTPEANVHAVAELTISLIFSIARKIPEAFNSMKTGNWKTFLGHEIYNKIIGVVGTGKIGRAVIEKLSGMNVSILAYDVIHSPDVENYQMSHIQN